MLFTSYVFWIFFLVVIVLYKLASHVLRNRILLVASYVFYAYWDWRYLFLLFLSTTINYCTVTSITRTNLQAHRKTILALSVAANLCLLGVFKYYDFFISEFLKAFSLPGTGLDVPLLHIALPVGISFYTFQAMAYTVEAYRGAALPDPPLLDFALYVAFFPLLLAGPIERPNRLMPQILTPRPRRHDCFSVGLYYVLVGLFKKSVIADNMAPIVTTVFSGDLSQLSGADCLIGVYAFALQIYGDFAGYSSIASGVAYWLGFDIMKNFDVPYFSESIQDFWRRWHISLSSWFRDYVYIPLGGSRFGRFATVRNLMLTMALCGLWHGANYTFICWGIFHGLLLVGYHLFSRPKSETGLGNRSPLSRVMKILLTFNLVCIGWLIFRAESLTQVSIILGRMLFHFEPTHFTLYGLGMLLFYALPLLLFEYRFQSPSDLLEPSRAHWTIRGALYGYFVVMLLVFSPTRPQQFIYFRF